MGNIISSWATAGKEVLCANPLSTVFKLAALTLSYGEYGVFRISGLEKKILNSLRSHDTFFENTLESLGIKFELSGPGSRLFDVGASGRGPFLLASNHPTGITNSLILGALMERLGAGFRIFADTRMDNTRLCPQLGIVLQDRLLLIDRSNTDSAEQQRMTALSKSCELLREGNNIALYPAGTRSSPKGLFGGQVEDRPWLDGAAVILKEGGPNVRLLPIYIQNRNNVFTHILSHLAHFLARKSIALGPTLKNALSLADTLNPRVINVRIGAPRTLAELKAEANIKTANCPRENLTKAMRAHVDALAS